MDCKYESVDQVLNSGHVHGCRVVACGVRAGVSGLRKVGALGSLVAFGRSGSGQSVRRHGSDKLRHATGRACATEANTGQRLAPRRRARVWHNRCISFDRHIGSPDKWSQSLCNGRVELSVPGTVANILFISCCTALTEITASCCYLHYGSKRYGKQDTSTDPCGPWRHGSVEVLLLC